MGQDRAAKRLWAPLRGFGHTSGHYDGATQVGSSQRWRPARDASRQLQEWTWRGGRPVSWALQERAPGASRPSPGGPRTVQTVLLRQRIHPLRLQVEGFPSACSVPRALRPVPCGPAPSHAGDKVNDKRPPLSTWRVPGAASCPQHPCFPREGTERRAWGPRRGTRQVAGCGPGGRRGPLRVKVSRGPRERSWGPENP